MINSIMIGFLAYEVVKLRKQVNRQSKIVSNLKVSDFDEEFWED